jgi:predicted 2-oxoglutarate/Fe(II)-dependent dioxygenase YbiX
VSAAHNPGIDAVVQVPLLSAGQCAAIVDRAGALPWEPALINVGEDAPQARRCETVSLSGCASEVLGEEALGTLLACARYFNERCWRFVLGGGLELNLLRYGPGDHYARWHTDLFAEASTRKLSFSVQLTADYTGGALWMQEKTAPASRALGDIILFPAFTPHRVEPVTAGVRLALVGWLHGPPFR